MTMYRLREDHPLLSALEKLFATADGSGIRIEYFNNNVIVSYEGREYRLFDNDSGEPALEFPPRFEYKLVYEKDETVSEEVNDG